LKLNQKSGYEIYSWRTKKSQGFEWGGGRGTGRVLKEKKKNIQNTLIPKPIPVRGKKQHKRVGGQLTLAGSLRRGKNPESRRSPLRPAAGERVDCEKRCPGRYWSEEEGDKKKPTTQSWRKTGGCGFCKLGVLRRVIKLQRKLGENGAR